MRSKLFVPGSRPELFGKALTSAADAISFDLEDAVAKERKLQARASVAELLRSEALNAQKTIIVRVNPVGTKLFAGDVEAVVSPQLDLINLPMVEDVDTVREAALFLDRVEQENAIPRGIRILVNIETPRALRKVAALAAAHPRVAGLQIGFADLLEPYGIDRADEVALAHIRVTVRLAAAEAGIPAYDGAYALVQDPEGYRRECIRARQHGFAGKSCIHPSQVAIANEVFKPTVQEFERAQRLLAAASDAETRGAGAYLVDGHMIDAPFLSRARAIVEFARQYPSLIDK